MLYDWKKARIKRVGVKHNQFVFAHSSISNNSKVNVRKLLCKNKLSNFRPIQKLWIITKSYNIQNGSKRTSWLKISENIFLEIIQSTFFSNFDVSIWKIRCSCFSTYICIIFAQKNDSRMFHSLGLPKKERLFLFNSFIVFCTFGFTFVF